MATTVRSRKKEHRLRGIENVKQCGVVILSCPTKCLQYPNIVSEKLHAVIEEQQR
jgi:hypothetical protein